MDSPDKSFFSKVFSFLQCFYQLWLSVALCTLGDFYLNYIEHLKRKKRKKENLSTYLFNQTLQLYTNLPKQMKKQAWMD